MFTNDRDQLRKFWVDMWQRSQRGEPLDPLAQQVVEVIREHPEYHALLTEKAMQREFLPESGEVNPFLHMGMHLALREQTSTDRPQGIRHIFNQLSLKVGSPHEAEHRMMDCLGEALWQAQRHQTPPDESAYLECLKALLTD